jgi:hypothetical protein
VEIGAGNGIHNNTAFLAILHKFSGLMVDGDAKRQQKAKNIYSFINSAINCESLFIRNEIDIKKLAAGFTYKDPDFFSLDIDGIDYYVMRWILEEKIRPKIICVEYNSSYGPDRSCTIKYHPEFNRMKAHSLGFYFGVSVKGWINLFKKYNYEFVTVSSNGVNAYFVDCSCFETEFLNSIRHNGLKYTECYSLKNKFRINWEGQFDHIKQMELLTI